ncbi:MAG: DMT family transporter [Bdellovibrionales bacterium]|nr:DMT family transporter [Bdellovibrionales bacterium]
MAALSRHARAVWMLVLATVLWGVSFPVYKALVLEQARLLPGVSSWFLASSSLLVRFFTGALVLGLVRPRMAREITRKEIKQGVGLGITAALGLLWQMDGLTYTDASISAFLTQSYSFIIPLWLCLTRRQWPSLHLVGSCALVVWGVALLSRVDFTHFHLGRGETETLLCSLAFTGQILWLERPEFNRNDVFRSLFVMFSVIALVMLPVTLFHMQSPADLLRVYSSGFAVSMVGVLIVVCTLASYWVMNTWQPHVTASEAGLIYCIEPVFTVLMALKLPAWLSHWSGVVYPNETITSDFVWGAILVLAANALLQSRAWNKLAL